MATTFDASFKTKRFLLTDSRQVISPQQSIFFAIRGPRHNGHQFIPELYTQGIRHFVIEETIAQNQFPDAYFVQVANSIQALQALVTQHRAQFTLPVISITGSNGKTTIKEWLYELLESYFTIVKSPKSFNSQIGVPLSVWEVRPEHQLGIFEAGISQVGEMEKLASIIQPTIGIFSNIGTAHQEGFQSKSEKIREKLKLFANADMLIYCVDHTGIHLQAQQLPCKTFTWGKAVSANLQIIQAPLPRKHGAYHCRFQQQEFSLTLPFNDQASVENLFHCIACMLHLGIPIQEIQNRLSQLQHVTMRLELKQGMNQCLVVDDTYNNDLAGLAVALDFTAQQDDTKTRTVILSDMLETGQQLEKVYTTVNQLLQGQNIQRFIGIGPSLRAYSNAIQCSSKEFFPSVKAFFDAQPQFHNELILVKGARTFGLEQIVHRLQQKVHGTQLEVNLEALAHNLNVYRGLLKPSTKVMVMVKAFAYGSGGYEVAKLLQYHRVDYLAVAYADEGVELRQKGIKLPIMVMNPSPDTFDTLIAHQLEPEIYSFRILKSLLTYLKHFPQNQTLPVHLKLDTGMHRLGFEEHMLEQLIPILQEAKQLRIQSVFTHLAGSDESIHNDYSQQQLHTFQDMVNTLETAITYPFIKHALNSPGITRFPNHQFDMVRLGIGLYGVDTNQLYQDQLQMAGRLKTTISQIRTVDAGTTIGYGRKGKVNSPSQIAVMAIGYADGYDRRFSNGIGKVLIHGQEAAVIGNVCMDMTMLDVTDLHVQEGDEVILFGQKPNIIDMAKSIGTIPYEILTNVSDRVKRVFYRE